MMHSKVGKKAGKLLSLLAAVALVIGTVPFNNAVFAAAEGQHECTIHYPPEDSEWILLDENTTELEAGKYYYLKEDLTFTNDLDFNDESGWYYICMNGHNIAFEDGAQLKASDGVSLDIRNCGDADGSITADLEYSLHLDERIHGLTKSDYDILKSAEFVVYSQNGAFNIDSSSVDRSNNSLWKVKFDNVPLFNDNYEKNYIDIRFKEQALNEDYNEYLEGTEHQVRIQNAFDDEGNPIDDPYQKGLTSVHPFKNVVLSARIDYDESVTENNSEFTAYLLRDGEIIRAFTFDVIKNQSIQFVYLDGYFVVDEYGQLQDTSDTYIEIPVFWDGYQAEYSIEVDSDQYSLAVKELDPIENPLGSWPSYDYTYVYEIEQGNKVDSVELSIDNPKNGYTLPTSATASTIGITVEKVEWSQNGNTLESSAKAVEGETYMVTATLKANSGYYIPYDVSATVNGEEAAYVQKHADGTVTVDYYMTAEEAAEINFTGFEALTDVNIAFDATETEIQDKLPATVTIQTTEGNKTAFVNWTTVPTIDTDDLDGQTITAEGTITLPDGVTNPNDVSTNITRKFNVAAAPQAEKADSIPVDTDGNGEEDKTVDATKNDDGFYYADVDDKDGKEKLIPVDIDGDGDIDHYVPDGVLIDDEDEEKKDGIYTPKDETTPKYVGIDGDDEGTEPDKFIKVEDSDGDGIYGDDANGDGEYDGLADDEGKEDNHYIPDQDGDGLAEPETDKDGIFEGTDDGEEYIPVDKTGDGKADDIVQVTDDDDDGIYEDKDGNRYIPDQDGDGLAEPDTDGNGAFEGTDKDGNGKEYIPVDNTPDKPDGTVDEIIEAEEKDDAYKDDANDDSVFGGEGDNAYVPIDDDNDGDIDRYIPEDKFNEEDYEPIDKDDDGDIDHYVPEDKFDKKEYAPIDDDNDGDIDRYIPEDELDEEKYVGIDDGNDGDPDRYIPKSEDVGHTHDASRPATCKERAFCSICKDFYGEPLGHDWGGWIKISATMHQRVCKNDAEHAETGRHNPALDCATGAQCGICGAAGKDSHEYDRSKWVSEEGADTHWYGCIHCGAKDPDNEKPHDYPNKNVGKDVPQTCPTCNCGGYITEVHPEDFDKYEIPEAIREKYKTVDEIENAMEKVARENDQRVDGTLIFDAVLKYSVDGGDNWFVASEEHFPKNADGTYGKLPVKIEVPKETNIDTHDYKVVHMFSQSSKSLKTKDGKPTVAGETETPDVIEEKGADGKEYISFYVNGLSPIMVAWEATPLNTARSIDDGENNNGEEDNAGGIPIDDNNDGEIDRYITEDEFDPDKYIPIDKDGDGDIDHYVPKDKFDKDKYVPIDIDGDDEADYYIPNGILTDPDGDGTYTPDGKKGPKYEGVDIDGDGVIDMFLLLDDEEGNGIDSGDDSDMLSWLLLMMTALTAGAITITSRRYSRN